MREELKKTGREVKKALTAAFKGVKFQVKTCTSAYYSVDVTWTDGPSLVAVEAVTAQFDSSKDFSDPQRDYFRVDGITVNTTREISPEFGRAIDQMVLEQLSIAAEDKEIKTAQYRAYRAHKVNANAFELIPDYEKYSPLGFRQIIF